MPEFTVIVLNWNGMRFLSTCLAALRQQTYRDFETIFVDNGSEDRSVAFVRESFPEARIVALPQNIGFSAGNLKGYEEARGKWIILLNNDTEVAANWLEEINKARQNFPNAESFASKMLYFDDRKTIDNCGFGVTRGGATLDFGRGEQDGPSWAKPRRVFGGCGGAVAYSRSMLDDIGFLDPDFFMTYEDADLSFRAQLRGYECMFVPGAVVYHRYRGTMTNYPARQVYFSQRNIEFVYFKNMPLTLILRYLPHHLLYELGSALYFTRLGAGRAFLAAKFDALRQLPSILKKRREIQQSRSISIAELRKALTGSALDTKWKKLFSAWVQRSEKTTTQPHAAD